MRKDKSEESKFEYLVQNMIDAGIVSSKKQLAEVIDLSEESIDEIVAEYEGKEMWPSILIGPISCMVPDYNAGWWYKGNRQFDFLTINDNYNYNKSISDFRERFNSLANYAKSSTNTEDFTQRFGKSKYDVQKEFNDMFSTIAHIKRKFPELNEKWLLFGEGEMFRKPSDFTEGAGYYNTIFNLDRVVTDIDKILGEGYAASHPEFLSSVINASSIRNASYEIESSLNSLYRSLDALTMMLKDKLIAK